MRRLLLCGLALASSACAAIPSGQTIGQTKGQTTGQTAGCDGGPVAVRSDFEVAGQVDCRRRGPASFTLTVLPEATPINPSPWYAFDLVAGQATAVEIVLDYGTAKHRYWPKQQTSQGWVRLPESSVEILADGTRARLALTTPQGTTRIAAQEILTPQAREDWAADWAARAGFHLRTIGQSRSGRPIVAISNHAEPQAGPLILILGGQHPPEMTGVIGLHAFLETFTEPQPELSGLLATHTLLIVPDLNPDGVAAGHWRLNADAVDLNRDWGPFTQPETQAVKSEIDRYGAAGAVPLVLLDFHSTFRNVFYTPPDEAGLTPPNLSRQLMERLATLWPGEQPARSGDHNLGKPTAKSWFADTYKAPGLTIEFADEADRGTVRGLARASALALIDVLSSLRPPDEEAQ